MISSNSHISDTKYEKFTPDYDDDYDSSNGDLVQNKDKKHFPARRKDVLFEKKRRKKEFWLDKQIKKLSHHTNDIKLESSTHSIPGRHGQLNNQYNLIIIATPKSSEHYMYIYYQL